MNKLLLSFFIFICLISSIEESYSQSQKKVMQFSGLVVSGDSAFGVQGVYVYVPKAGRGTTTNYLGYFSLPTLVGDSVIIKAIGYTEKHFVVTDNNKDNISVIIEIEEDRSLLPTVEVFPWPTEQIFKEAFLAMRLPEEEMDNMHKNLNEKVMQRMMGTLRDDGSLNYKYSMQQQLQRSDGRFYYPTLTLLNPFAWARFISSAKHGGLRPTEKEDMRDDKK